MLTPAEWAQILAQKEGLILLKGKWVEIDAQELKLVLSRWKQAQAAASDGLSFLEAMRLLNYRMAADVTLGRVDVGLAAAAKVFGTETPIAVFRKLLEVVGSGGLYRRDSAAAVLAARLEEEYRLALINTFGGGVNELLRDLASQFGLGMPRAAR